MYKELFESYVNAVNNWNPEAIVNLFTEDGVFDDKGTRGIYKPEDVPPTLYGQEQIRNTFQAWTALDIKITVVEIKGNVMYYDVVTEGVFIPAVGVAEVRDGKFECYTIRPRHDD